MPFKTRKKKRAAVKNRISVTESGFISYSAADNSVDVPVKISSRGRNDQLNEELNLPGFKKEIVRIALLAALIIGFQLALKFSNLPFIK